MMLMFRVEDRYQREGRDIRSCISLAHRGRLYRERTAAPTIQSQIIPELTVVHVSQCCWLEVVHERDLKRMS
ncbi:hypothetical protein SISNIDRAFT_228372 [Sistotremastrum niveocremeum HHB9708]|uniref:Uncharacterized protein n=1 Tax=Sistotremastrum niveocremeum HHB9708 TaxID=1314777 RepID=A0A164Q4Z8_9AGAM|nr:hypothetical protein SISNIDRAFT_228372 [Sistotremastrum niveocremeum HHB9708]